MRFYLWSDESCDWHLPGHENVCEAWLRLFGFTFRKEDAVFVIDPDFEASYVMPSGCRVTFAADGDYIGLHCFACGGGAKLLTGADVYGAAHPHLATKRIWACRRWPECDSYVGCHGDTDLPLGRMADPDHRRAKQAAHAAFDPLWRRQEAKGVKDARSRGYAWLAGRLNVKPEFCHIGMFDAATCGRVVELCMPYLPKGGAG